MAAPFPSQVWADQFQQILNTSDVYRSAAQTWEGDVLLVIEDVGAFYLDLWHGVCRTATYIATYTPDNQSQSAAYTITATLETWRKVLARQLEPMQGMMSRQLRLDGNLMKLMQYINAAQELVKCAARVGIEE